ncbi:unnamed protein product [Sphagnum jensenii]|uniref:Uncharacterized protein n=1 Tax=Sphagnum jensenii TaxID=128206 RepID=A0ABP1AAA0_9BRYO
MKRCFGIRSSNQRFIIRGQRVMYEPGNTSLASFKQKHSFVLPPPRKWHFPARRDEDILGKCRSDYDEAAKVLINGLKADGWLSLASVRLVIENMIDVIRHPAQMIGDFMRSPFKFSNDTKELVAMVLDSTPEVNSVFDRMDEFVLEETTNLDNFLEVINHLHSAQTSYPFSLIRKRGLWRIIRKHDWNMQTLFANQFVFSNASPH